MPCRTRTRCQSSSPPRFAKQGGHVGFIHGGTLWGPRYHVPRCINEFLDGHLTEIGPLAIFADSSLGSTNSGSNFTLAELVPQDIVYVEATPEMWTAGLLSGEEQYVSRAAHKRIAEFTAGRNCARRALQLLGVKPVPIPVGPNREPIWPTGTIGSITHSKRFCAAVVAPLETTRSVGIDAESNEPLPPEVRKLVCTEAEIRWINDQASIRTDAGICWDKIIFSCKESVYKAFFPIYRKFLDFQEATLAIDADTRTFTASIRDNESGCSGAFRIDSDRVYSIVVIR